ncbi:hypothetical protein MHTCC0001_05740 [Flavobacteriaceae bacterium MHTCC 0001]
MKPKVSIIVPNYNHSLFLKNRLESIFNQTFQDFEVILLDDCSTDNSLEILGDYANHVNVVHYLVNSSNSGSPFKQWKKGIDLAKGDYIWIAESDDYSALKFLELTVEALLKGVDICYTQSYDINESGKNLKSRVYYTNEFKPNIWESDFIIDGNTFNEKYLLVKNVIPNASAVLFKRSVVKTAFFDDKLLQMKMCGDWLFWLRLLANNKVMFISEHLNYFRYHSNVTREHGNRKKQKLRLLEETILKKDAYENLSIPLKKSHKLFYNKWFKVHKISDVFTKQFYDIRLPETSMKTLFLEFFKEKLKSYHLF